MSKIRKFLILLDDATNIVPDETVQGWLRRGP